MPDITHRFALCALFALLWASMFASGQEQSEMKGYRMEDYRAPTLATSQGRTRGDHGGSRANLEGGGRDLY